jgi:hypothetical protein
MDDLAINLDEQVNWLPPPADRPPFHVDLVAYIYSVRAYITSHIFDQLARDPPSMV